jgi:hypothetical protein
VISALHQPNEEESMDDVLRIQDLSATELGELEGLKTLATTAGGYLHIEVRKRKLAPEPTGVCFCGCGTLVSPTARWESGHDQRVMAEIFTDTYGSIADFAVAHGRL